MITPQTEKRCASCKQVLPVLLFFYKNRSRYDGYMNRCKICNRQRNKQRTPVRLEARKRKDLRQREKNPEKIKMYQVVRKAIKKGTLVREPCEKCGAVPTEAHHDDYNKPLQVRWLCVTHHNEHHLGKLPLTTAQA